MSLHPVFFFLARRALENSGKSFSITTTALALYSTYVCCYIGFICISDDGFSLDLLFHISDSKLFSCSGRCKEIRQTCEEPIFGMICMVVSSA